MDGLEPKDEPKWAGTMKWSGTFVFLDHEGRPFDASSPLLISKIRGLIGAFEAISGDVPLKIINMAVEDMDGVPIVRVQVAPDDALNERTILAFIRGKLEAEKPAAVS